MTIRFAGARNDHQRRWRAKKRKAEIAAGLRPRRKRKPKSAAEIKRSYRARRKAREAEAEKTAKYAASRERRAKSRSAPEVQPEFRVGDCREALSDIADGSVALVLTDPPYGNASEPLYRWLGDFAARVLMPGGSLVCFAGQTTWLRDASIFARTLAVRPILHMPHDTEHRMRGVLLSRVERRMGEAPRRARSTFQGRQPGP
jgi:hypothetical protein